MKSEHFTDLIVSDHDSGGLKFRTYTIEVVEGPDRGRSLKVDRGSVVVGTGAGADLVLTDGAVSRAHVRLVPFGDGVEITDLESKNGTYLAGTRLMHARVAPGSEFRIGRTTIRISPDDREAALEPSEHTVFGALHGRSRAMRQLFALLEHAARSEAMVLFEGEHGTGKLRAARSLHQRSARAAGPFEEVVVKAQSGEEWLEPLADHAGTVVLRDVDRLEASLQAALLRALEERRVQARLVSTTERDLKQLTNQGLFDRALFLKLAVLRVRVPPLRERASDLPLLIADILTELGHSSFELGPADLGRMQAYAWPDNVSELYAVIQRAVSLEGASPERPPDVPPPLPSTEAVVGADLPYKQARAQMIEAFEREYIRGLLERHEGNVSKAARVAGIDRVYLHRLLRKYGL